MSAEIKFRMWTGTNMLYDVSNVYECLKQQKAFDEGIRVGDQVGVIPYNHEGDGSVFLQFTGEKDSDNKDVFIGDIYEYDYEYDSDYDGDMPIVKRSAGRNKVEYLSDTYNIRTAKSEGGKVRVIGNIYQTPNLLTAKE